MKILFICERFNGHSIKVQPWKHVFELAKGLQRRKHEICILTDKDSDLSNKELILAKLRIKSVRKGKFLFNMQDLNKVLSEDFDIINWHASSIISSLQFKHLKNIRQNFVWTLHSGIIDFDTLHNLKIADALLLTSLWSHFLSSLAPAFLLRNTASFPHMKAIITLSKRMKNYFIKFGINENIVHVIYSGVDVEKYHPRNERYTSKIKEELGFKNDESIILYYGPLNSLRGVDELIKAIPRISSMLSKVRFVFLGRLARYDFISRKIKKSLLNCKSAFLVEGFLEQNVLLKYLYAADLVVLPFRFWPYVECPLTVLEIMALGKPLITTNIGAIPEIVHNNENGVLVRPKSTLIANAILRLLRDKDFSIKLGYNARRYVEKNHPWEKIIDETESLFESLIE